MLRLNVDASGRHRSLPLLNAVFELPRNQVWFRWDEFAVSSEQPHAAGITFRMQFHVFSEESSIPQTCFESTFCVHTFCQGSNQRCISGSVSVPSRVVLWISVLSDRVSQEPAGAVSTWGLGPGAWRGLLCHEQNWKKEESPRGWIAVSSGDGSHSGLGSSALGSCRHEQNSQLWSPQG